MIDDLRLRHGFGMMTALEFRRSFFGWWDTGGWWLELDPRALRSFLSTSQGRYIAPGERTWRWLNGLSVCDSDGGTAAWPRGIAPRRWHGPDCSALSQASTVSNADGVNASWTGPTGTWTLEFGWDRDGIAMLSPVLCFSSAWHRVEGPTTVPWIIVSGALPSEVQADQVDGTTGQLARAANVERNGGNDGTGCSGTQALRRDHNEDGDGGGSDRVQSTSGTTFLSHSNGAGSRLSDSATSSTGLSSHGRGVSGDQRATESPAAVIESMLNWRRGSRVLVSLSAIFLLGLLPFGTRAGGWESDGPAGGLTPPAGLGTRLLYFPLICRCYSTAARVQVALRFATTLAHEFALNDIRLIVYCERLHILVGGVGERYGYLGAWTRQCNGDYPFQRYTSRLFSSSLPSGLLAHGWKSDGLAGGPTPPASPGTRLPFSPFDLRCYSTDFRLQALLIVIAAVMASADRHFFMATTTVLMDLHSIYWASKQIADGQRCKLDFKGYKDYCSGQWVHE